MQPHSFKALTLPMPNSCCPHSSLPSKDHHTQIILSGRIERHLAHKISKSSSINLPIHQNLKIHFPTAISATNASPLSSRPLSRHERLHPTSLPPDKPLSRKHAVMLLWLLPFMLLRFLFLVYEVLPGVGQKRTDSMAYFWICGPWSGTRTLIFVVGRK